MHSSSGYEYEVIGRCPNTGRPIVAPKAWSTKKRERPSYATCLCCRRVKKAA